MIFPILTGLKSLDSSLGPLYFVNGSMYVSGKLPTYPFPNLTFTLLALSKMLGLGRGKWAVSQKHTLMLNIETLGKFDMYPMLLLICSVNRDIQRVACFSMQQLNSGNTM